MINNENIAIKISISIQGEAEAGCGGEGDGRLIKEGRYVVSTYWYWPPENLEFLSVFTEEIRCSSGG